MVAFLDSFFDQLEEVSTSPWFYAIIFVVALLDSVIPVVPSETVVILGGIAAGIGDLKVGIVVAAGAFGAIIGDNIAYAIGHRFSDRIQRWYGRTPERARKLLWAARQLDTRGGSLLLTARFIPGGRSIITLTSGITRQRRLRFVFFVTIACTIWASFGAALGYFFGSRFKDDHTTAFLVAFAASIAFTMVVEIVRHARNKNRGDAPSAAAAEGA